MRTGVLLMAHGTPSSLDEMPEYLRLVRGGRPASEELVAEMRGNYGAIGGRSPLTDITNAQAAALRERLGPEMSVAVGMRNWHPFIKDALSDLASAGVTRVVTGIPIWRRSTRQSVQKYIDRRWAALP
jgi:ferrochelatase